MGVKDCFKSRSVEKSVALLPRSHLVCGRATVPPKSMSEIQKTIVKSVTQSGIGLHAGQKVTMTLHPAPANSGIRFRRVDLEGKPEIPALVHYVTENARSTTLSIGPARAQTVEHAMAFMGFGIDNLVVDIDASEPPIGDGSSRFYNRLIEEAGIVELDTPRQFCVLREPLELNHGETMMHAFPYDGLKLTCTSVDRRGHFTQFHSLEIDESTWSELSEARTFCFYEEIEALIRNGLIKGGSLENAVVIRDDAVLTIEPLRYPNEFVRHKMLDILGDISLIGSPLKAHIIAVRPSHAANCEMARLIVKSNETPSK